jgi:type IV pilus assembly protein PilM
MRKITGVDIGSYSIKIIELEEKKGYSELSGCVLKRVMNGDPQAALKEIFSSGKPASRCVNVSLSGPAVILRYIEMPPMKKEEVKSAIKFEAEKYIPFEVNNSIIDCAMLDKTKTGAQRVLLAAAKKDEVENILRFFNGIGVEINAIDIDTLALLNSFERTGTAGKDKDLYALINIGGKFSNMAIVLNGSVCFTRDIFSGGMDITNRIMEAMRVDSDAAEKLKLDPGDKREEVSGLILPVLEKLAGQIRKSFDYFESQFGRNVGNIYVSGGSAYLFNMLDVLKENLGTDVMMWNPFEGIRKGESVKDNELKKTSALFAVAMGLALRK